MILQSNYLDMKRTTFAVAALLVVMFTNLVADEHLAVTSIQVLKDSENNILIEEGCRSLSNKLLTESGWADSVSGSAKIVRGKLIYTPKSGFSGKDRLAVTMTSGPAKILEVDVREFPNFVFILTDDQGWSSLSVQMDKNRPDSKSDYYQSPNIEKLALQGMRFSRGYSPAPNCSPTRYANLTGKTCARLLFTDIVNRGHDTDLKGTVKLHPGGKGVYAIEQKDTTIPELLRTIPKANYTSAHWGKWHLGRKDTPSEAPEAHGFDFSDGLTSNGQGNQGEVANDDPKKAFYITQRAIEFMTSAVADDRPFYCQVSHYAVHSVIQYRSETLESFANVPKGKIHTNPEYAAMVADLDASVGILLDHLDELGISNSTYVIYQADNGSPKFMSVSPPLRRYKPEIWDGGTRVPTFMKGPGIEANSQCDTPMMGIDLLPTIWELTGGESSKLPSDLDGGSLVPLIIGNGVEQTPSSVDRPGEMVVHSPHYVVSPKDLGKNQRPSSAIYDGRWKLVAWYETGQISLFDIDNDISESFDVGEFYPEIKNDLWQRLRNYLAEVGALLPALDPAHVSHPNPKPGDVDADGLPDAWEFEQLLTHSFGPKDDPDMDGKTNAQEHRSGTDPLS